jgi:hypothetical protein
VKPFHEVEKRPIPESKVRAMARVLNRPEEEVRAYMEREMEGVTRIVRNNRYQVAIYETKSENPEAPPMVLLSIKRIDRQPIHDWRDLQKIKSMLVGPECEGVELYPAESRVADTANQYHLWVVADPTFRWPFGFSGGRVIATPAQAAAAGAVQRPFEE